MELGDLTDERWAELEVLEPLLPREMKEGRPPVLLRGEQMPDFHDEVMEVLEAAGEHL